MPIKSVEDLFSEIDGKGWRVLNLFQLGATGWRCNLQRRAENGGMEEIFTEFADGRTPHEAIAGAIRNADARRNAPARGVRTAEPPKPEVTSEAPWLSPEAELGLVALAAFVALHTEAVKSRTAALQQGADL